MVDLYLHGHKIGNFFQLLGEDENDISCSMAWALARCPEFLKAFLCAIGYKSHINYADTCVRLQHYERAKGFTDIEIVSTDDFYVIIEAKRGWNLPTRRQLQKYGSQRSFTQSRAPFKKILALSECSREYAQLNLGTQHLRGVPVEAVSWREIATAVRDARSKSSNAEKRMLDEWSTYLEGVTTMQDIDSDWVYVVSLANNKPPGWDISWIDIVEKRRRYFHPVGEGRGGWPREPPHYIAFRHHGKLQSIHHIEGYEIVPNVHGRIPEIPDVDWEEEHFLYKLGRGFGPEREVKTGRIWSNGRVWCMIDTLFTCRTIADASKLSKKRQQQTMT